MSKNPLSLQRFFYKAGMIVLVTNITATNVATTVMTCRAFLLKSHTDARVMGEFAATVAGRNGLGFDVEWSPAENVYQRQRIVFVPAQFGLAVFSATSPSNAFEDIKTKLRLVMATFRATDDGKFHPVHIGEAS